MARVKQEDTESRQDRSSSEDDHDVASHSEAPQTPQRARLIASPSRTPGNVSFSFDIPKRLLAQTQFALTFTPNGNHYTTTFNETSPIAQPNFLTSETSTQIPRADLPANVQRRQPSAAPTQVPRPSTYQTSPPPTPTRATLRPSTSDYRDTLPRPPPSPVPVGRMLTAEDPIYPRKRGDVHVHDPVPDEATEPMGYWIVTEGLKIGVFYCKWKYIEEIAKDAGGHWNKSMNLRAACTKWDTVRRKRIIE